MGAGQPDGTRVAYQSNNQIYVIDPDTGERFGSFPPNSFDPAWSPDSTTLAYARGASVCLMETYPQEGGSASLASALGQEVSWSPDSSRLAYVDGGRIMVADADGGNGMQVAEVNLHRDPLKPFNLQWSPDGTRLSYMFLEFDTSASDMWIYIVDLASPGTPTKLVSPSLPEYDWSPDGRLIVYEVQEDDSCHYPDVIYTIRSDGIGGPRRIVRGSSPSWSPNGSQIAFIQMTLPDTCPTPIVQY